jgi:Flp pilus assembly protein TadB
VVVTGEEKKQKRNETNKTRRHIHTHHERRKKRERGASWHDSLLIQITYQQACRHVQKVVSELYFVFLALACLLAFFFSGFFFLPVFLVVAFLCPL